MSAPEWELSKENVAPVSRGRNVATLNAALNARPDELEERRAFHEAAIRDAANGLGPCAEDPLAPWVSYVKWAVDFYPRGSDLIVTVVEGACRTFSKAERYREDRRFVRLWIRYADLRKDKLDVFAYMQRRRIGEHAALFYEAWAMAFELARMYGKAEETYELGLRLKAEPTPRLEQRQREFINRMAARARRAEKKKHDAQEKKKGAEKVRQSAQANRTHRTLADDILTRPDRPGDDDGQMAPVTEGQAHGSSSRQRQMIRPALGSISERQAQSGQRPVADAIRKQATKSTSRLCAPGLENGAHVNGKRNVPTEKVEIYADPGSKAVSPLTVHKQKIEAEERFPLPLVAKREDVQKENDGRVPEKWAGQTLPQDKKALAKLNRGDLAARPRFEIYQDSQDEGHPQEKAEDSTEEHLLHQSDGQGKNREPRQQSPAPARKASGRMTPVSPTINTKIAMEQVEGMFNSPLPMERVRDDIVQAISPKTRLATEHNSRQLAPVQIFHDVGGEDDKENGLGTVNPSGGVAGPSSHPDLEKRVLQSIPALEGPLIRRTSNADDKEVCRPNAKQVESKLTCSDSDVSRDFGDFLAKWCNSEPGYQLIESPDPEVEKDGMFDLHPRGMPVVALNVDNYLWNGYRGMSQVVVVEDMNNVFNLRDTVEMADIDEDDEVLALKVSELSDTPNAWEFYIYKTLHDRYGSPLKSVATAIAFYEGSPRSFLVLDSVCWCSMFEAMSCSEDGYLSESLAMFFTVDLLRTVEAVHTVGIIHGDVTLENVLFRSDPGVTLDEDRYIASGAGSWSSKGVLLVDFNHAIDSKQATPGELNMSVLASHAAALGNGFLHPAYRIPNAMSWGFNADCFATAVCASKLLGLEGFRMKGLQRQFKHDRIWDSLFTSMQNLTAASKPSETVDTMRRCRETMEGALVSEKWLKLSLERLAAHVATKDLEDETMV